MMMERLWMMGIQASVLIVVVLLLRLLLKKCSKVYSYCLWMLVLLRLLCPVFIESRMSLQPDFRNLDSVFSTEGGIMQLASSSEKDQDIQPKFSLPVQERSSWVSSIWTFQGGLRIMWAVGAVFMFFWFVYQYIDIRKKVSTAVLEEDHVFFCENIKTPFVMGIFNPRIYLPYKIKEEEKDYILSHERVHIKHKDPVIRMVGILAICLHWWNPLVWYGIHKMTQDMEMFCDETVLKKATMGERKAYSTALLHAAIKQNSFSIVIPFGESRTEQRIRNILTKKHKGILITTFAFILFAGCTFAFLTSPISTKAVGAEDAESMLESMQQDLMTHQEKIKTLQKDAQEEAKLLQDTAFSAVQREAEEEVKKLQKEIEEKMAELSEENFIR